MASIVISGIPSKIAEAQALAKKLSLAYLPPAAMRSSHYDYALMLSAENLALYEINNRSSKPFVLDFTRGQLSYRSQTTSFHKEMLAKAIGIKPSLQPSLIDATAGLGRDAFILASLGYQVTMLERSGILFALLQDALMRAVKTPDLKPIITRMKLINTEAIDWLKAHGPFDVIYLDPMFPLRKKSAAVKKDMTILQHLIGPTLDDHQLFKTSMACADKRVVVKRPRLSPDINDQPPDFSLIGKSSRFDVYLV